MNRRDNHFASLPEAGFTLVEVMVVLVEGFDDGLDQAGLTVAAVGWGRLWSNFEVNYTFIRSDKLEVNRLGRCGGTVFNGEQETVAKTPHI